VLVLATVVLVAKWDYISEQLGALVPPDENSVAQNDKGKEPVVETPPPKPEPRTPTTKKATPVNEKPKEGPRPKKTESPRPVTPRPTPSNPETPKPKPTPPKPKPVPTRPANNPFPRRALVISVHDYLYANPVQNGPSTPPSAHNFKNFIEGLQRGLNIPFNQMTHLSDDADKKWGGSRAPTKPVIQKTLTSFLESSRTQDRIMIFFVGHSVELDDDVYLAPIEGELDKGDTLIPLKWFYEQMAKCKARQKVLVLDVNRFNQSFGQERPGGQEMGPKLDALLKVPPAGVQVWSSCSPKQRSFASDDTPMGVFLEELETICERKDRELPNLIQEPDKPLPLDRLVARVNERMKEELTPRKVEQVCRLTGTESDAGVTYNKDEPAAPDAVASLAGAAGDGGINVLLIESVLEQIGTPPVKVTHETTLRADALPNFSPEVLQKYQADTSDPKSPLRKAVKQARAVLWAMYPGGAEPKELSEEVEQWRKRIKIQLNVLRDGYRAPAGAGNAETQFKGRVESDERAVALLIGRLRDTIENLQADEVVEARKKESLRWKANYDFILARVQMEYAYLFEYQSMLGSMRKELPMRDPALHGGWKLASQATLQGDSTGKKAARDAQKLLDKIAKDNAGSPWEVLAKREKLTNLGLEWQPVK
jgi:hypothetical protein